jgi:DNA (cytosine-5)-methyltransferase 1
MSRPTLLDGCGGQGGAAVGYQRAGYDVTSVDNVPQPRNPLPFILADIVEYVAEHGHEYDVIHISPPCQFYSETERLMSSGHNYPRLIAPLRYILQGMQHPAWVIENVPNSPLTDPIVLCGAMFGLGTYRHRLFESNLALTAPLHLPHTMRQTKMGHTPVDGEMMHVVGNFTGVDEARRRMGIDWMNRDGLRESIPPAYSEYIGAQIMAYLAPVAVAA